MEKIGCKFTRITPAFENTIQLYMQQIERENRQKKLDRAWLTITTAYLSFWLTKGPSLFIGICSGAQSANFTQPDIDEHV